MAEGTDISWCDHTINFWVGCEEVGPECDNCYAKKWAARSGHPELWEGVLRRTKTWGDADKFDRAWLPFFHKHGRRQRVFSNSLSDFFDKRLPKEIRVDAWAKIRKCQNLDWYLVTKRISNVEKMLPADWGPKWTKHDGLAQPYPHVVIIITVGTKKAAARDIPRLCLLKTMYPWLRIGLSMEPLLEEVVLEDGWLKQLDWIIVGGESGGHARPMKMEWALALLAQAVKFGVPFHFKQIGSRHDGWPGEIAGPGTYPAEWPEALRVREWPVTAAGEKAAA